MKTSNLSNLQYLKVPPVQDAPVAQTETASLTPPGASATQGGAQTMRQKLLAAANVPTAKLIDKFLQQLEHRCDVQAHFAGMTDQALDVKYQYGLSVPDSFGHEANRNTAKAILNRLLGGDVQSFDARYADMEDLAAAAHQGWVDTVKDFYRDPCAKELGKKSDRQKLAGETYANLVESEKEKDRVAVRAILQDIEEPSKLKSWLINQTAR